MSGSREREDERLQLVRLPLLLLGFRARRGTGGGGGGRSVLTVEGVGLDGSVRGIHCIQSTERRETIVLSDFPLRGMVVRTGGDRP